MSDSSDVKSFYDEFATSTLLRDFRYLNLRQEAIKDLCRRFIPEGGRVLEIGCGVGIIAKFLRSRVSYLLGVDISDSNVRLARAYAGGGSVEFKVLDVIEEAHELEPHGRFDAILMPDVIEHIPKSAYGSLFSTIDKHLAEDGKLILTFPSPEYQEYLKARRPDALQVIDETVVPEELSAATSLKIVYLAYRDVWSKNQYVHLVLSRKQDYSDEHLPQSFVHRVVYRIKKYRWRLSNAGFLRHVHRER